MLRERVAIFLLALVLITSLAGCTKITPADSTQFNPESTPRPEDSIVVSPLLPTTQPASTPEIETPERTDLRPVSTLPVGSERVETPEVEQVMGEVPAILLNEIIADLAHKLGKDRASIEIIRAEAVTWNDGSLGCPKPGEFYIQMLINGYWVVLQVEGVEYDYRVSDAGYFTLCEAGDTIIDPAPLMPVAPHGKPPKGVLTKEP